MNLLPKSHKDFGQKDYWNTFFTKRGNKAFEWYGEYLELCGQLHKYVKAKDDILIVGCGNSALGADFYDVGYRKLTNIDVSEIVIKQMVSINKNRPEMKFLQMNALSTTFDDDAFSVIIDKGTLDALMPDNTEAVNENIDKYFSEIKRILRLGGRYVCISLLQEHIVKKLVSYFADNTWVFRIIRCHEAEQKNSEMGDGGTMPVFMVVATKFKALPQLMVEVCLAGDKMQRLQSAQDAVNAVKCVQEAAIVTNGLAKTSLVDENEVSLDLFKPGMDIPRYTIHIVDQAITRNMNKFAAFIVPQGRELDWMFSSVNGRLELLKSAQFGRLAIVSMHRGHQYGTLDNVKEELADSVRILAPKDYTGQIPFLSLGGDVGKREVCFEGNSEYSGKFVIEDVQGEDEIWFRRLIFLNNQFLVQSEAKLKIGKTRSGKPKKVIDHGYLACNHHSYMSIGVQETLLHHTGETFKVCIVGLGGGGLCSFLQKCFDNINITAVDIDKAIFEIARDYFELKVNEKLNVEIQDGIEFLKNAAENGSEYKSVIFDIDSKDRTNSLSCPPQEFIDNDVLEYVVKLIGDQGYFLLNLVCRESELYNAIVDTLKKLFKNVASYKIDEEVNEILYCSNKPGVTLRTALDKAAKELNSRARQKKLLDKSLVDVADFYKKLVVHANDTMQM